MGLQPLTPLPRGASKHDRRVIRLLLLASSTMAVLACGWAVYFAYRRQTLLVGYDLVVALAALAAMVLSRHGRQRVALYLVLGTSFVAICISAAFLDIPSPALPRGFHGFFLPLGVGAFAAMRNAPAWARNGFSIACFAAYAFFAGVNPVWTTEYRLPEAVRSVGVWVDNVAALGALYLAMQAIQNDAIRRNALEVQLRDAVLRNELVLHFQPQFDDVGRAVAAEALVRWQHPARGLVYPNDFIPVAESSGLMVPVGDWVLRAACAQLSEWAADPLFRDLQIAVNVSASQFAQPDFDRRVLQIVREAGVPASRLKLELTESMLAQDIDDLIGKMSALKAEGIRFSLDDFGTGYSSLAYLRRLPFDQLKIDQSFVRNMESSDKDGAIVSAVLALGASLELEVIAEGVETANHLRLLGEAGCTLFQGYFFSRPVPSAELCALLREQSKTVPRWALAKGARSPFEAPCAPQTASEAETATSGSRDAALFEHVPAHLVAVSQDVVHPR